MYKVIGIKPYEFSPKDKPDMVVSGYNLYVTYPMNEKQGTGMACERISLTTARCAECGYSPAVGDEITASYNRYGKVESVIVVDSKGK